MYRQSYGYLRWARREFCVWNDDKCEINLAKHGYDFFDIAEVFDGRPAMMRIDQRFDYGEDRFNLLSRLKGQTVNLAFTRHGLDIHIISARLASRKERVVFDAWEKREK
jgi:uncharacterized DUF497 family protein